jgi:hypothetical protein
VAVDLLGNDLNCWQQINNQVLQNQTVKAGQVRGFSYLLQQMHGD